MSALSNTTTAGPSFRSTSANSAPSSPIITESIKLIGGWLNVTRHREGVDLSRAKRVNRGSEEPGFLTLASRPVVPEFAPAAGSVASCEGAAAAKTARPSLDRSHRPISSIARSTSGTRPAPKMKLCWPSGRERRVTSTPASFARFAGRHLMFAVEDHDRWQAGQIGVEHIDPGIIPRHTCSADPRLSKPFHRLPGEKHVGCGVAFPRLVRHLRVVPR